MKLFQIIIIIILVFLFWHLKNKYEMFEYQLNEVQTNSNIMTIKKESKCGNLLFLKKKKIGDLN